MAQIYSSDTVNKQIIAEVAVRYNRAVNVTLESRNRFQDFLFQENTLLVSDATGRTIFNADIIAFPKCCAFGIVKNFVDKTKDQNLTNFLMDVLLCFDGERRIPGAYLVALPGDAQDSGKFDYLLRYPTFYKYFKERAFSGEVEVSNPVYDGRHSGLVLCCSLLGKTQTYVYQGDYVSYAEENFPNIGLFDSNHFQQKAA